MPENVAGEAVTVLAGEDLEAMRFVKLTGTDTVKYADAGESADAVYITAERKDNGELISVYPLTCGRRKVIANDELAANVVIYCANDGKVQDTPSGTSIGRLLSASTADGEEKYAYLIPVTQA